MPARKLSDFEKEKRQQLREAYGGMMNTVQVQHELGAKDRSTALIWLEGVPYYMVSTQKKWAIEDIARKLTEGRICE